MSLSFNLIKSWKPEFLLRIFSSQKVSTRLANLISIRGIFMKEIRKLFVFVLFSFSLLYSHISNAQEEVSWAFDPWPPLHEIKDGKAEGMIVEMLQAVFEKELGMKLVMEQLPWKRSQLVVERGEMDLLWTTKNKVRESYADFSKEPMEKMRNIIYTYKGHPKLAQMNAVKVFDDIKELDLTGAGILGDG